MNMVVASNPPIARAEDYCSAKIETFTSHLECGLPGERFEADQSDPLLVDFAHLLLGYALLAEGSDLPDPSRFNKSIGDLMVSGL